MSERENLLRRLTTDPKRTLLNFNVAAGTSVRSADDVMAAINRVLDGMERDGPRKLNRHPPDHNAASRQAWTA